MKPQVFQWLDRRWVPAVGLLGLNGPLLLWYAERMRDGGDELLGLVPLAGMFLLQPWPQWNEPVTARFYGFVLLLAIGSSLFAGILSPLVLAALLWVGINALVSGRGGLVGRLLLALGCLPSGASLDFYLGFPLRRVTTEVAAFTLRLLGEPVEAKGVVLSGPSGDVLIDVPCAGTHALWVALVATGFVFATLQFRWKSSLLGGVAALAGVLVSNAARAAGLYFFLSGRWPAVPGYHGGWGLFCFLLWFLPWLKLMNKSRLCAART